MRRLSPHQILVAGIALTGTALALPTNETQTVQTGDPCADIGGLTYTVPSKVLACYNSFTFDTNLRDNVVDTLSRSLDFHTSTNYQRQAPAPFTDVHTDVKGELTRIKGSSYNSDYAFHKDVSLEINKLRDGHANYVNLCYDSAFISFLPFPLVNINHGSWNLIQTIRIAPEAFELVSKEFAGYLSEWQAMAGFDFAKYSGATVLLIDGILPWFRVGQNSELIGDFQGRSTRQNSFFASYSRGAFSWTYRMGDFAARSLPPKKDHVKMTVKLANSWKIETINVPFISRSTVGPFTTGAELWSNNCRATPDTNGRDYFNFVNFSNDTATNTTVELVDPSPPKFLPPIAPQDRKQPISSIIDATAFTNIPLPDSLIPPNEVSGSGTARFYMQGKVGILALGSFSIGAEFTAWLDILTTGLNELKAQGATHLIVDVTNNGGGFVCVAAFLHRFLAGPKPSTEPQAGFDTKARYNPLASEIVNAIINGVVPRYQLFYDPLNWRYGDSSSFFPSNLNWLEPPVQTVVNGQQDAFSQKLGDECQPFLAAVPSEPFFPSENIGIVGNGRCASSCAIFSITMAKKEGVKTAVVGGLNFVSQQYSGTVGGQSLPFNILDSEIKSTNLKNHPLAPPDFLGNVWSIINWRLGFGVDNPAEPEEWQNHEASNSIPLTVETVNRPDAIWKDLANRWWPGV